MKKLILPLFIGLYQFAFSQTPIIWQKMMSYSGWDYSQTDSSLQNQSVLELTNHDLIFTMSGGYGEAVVERRSSNNSRIWNVHFGYNTNIHSAIEGSDGSIYVGGTVQGLPYTIRGLNLNTSTYVVDTFFHAKYDNASQLICTDCVYRNINGTGNNITQSGITNAVDWNKSMSQMVAKFSPDGILSWIRLYGGNNVLATGTSLVKAENDNVWIIGHGYGDDGDGDFVGSHQPPGQNGYTFDIMATKVSPSGQKILTKLYGSSSNEYLSDVNSIVSNGNGGFTMAIHLHNSINNIDGDIADATINDLNRTAIFNIDVNGSILWKKYMSYGEYGIGLSYSPKLSKNQNGGYFLMDNAIFGGIANTLPTGYHPFYEDAANYTGNHQSDIRITKLNSNGVEEWHKYYGGKFEESSSNIVGTTDGGAIFIGVAQSDDGDVENYHYGVVYSLNDCWIVKIDGNGIKQWSRAFGGTNTDIVSNHTTLAVLYDNKFIFSVYRPMSSDGDLTINTLGELNQTTWLVKAQLPCITLPPTAVTPNTRICAGSSLRLIATCQAGSNIKWYNDDQITPLTNTNVAPLTDTHYRVRCEGISNPNCISAFTQVKIWVSPNPTNPVITTSDIACGSGVYYLQGSCPSIPSVGIPTLQWFETDGITLSPAFIYPTTSPTLYKARCDFSYDGWYTSGNLTCSSNFSNKTVTQEAIPSDPTGIVTPQYVCTGSTITLGGNCPSTQTLHWYDDYYSTTPLNNTTISPSTSEYYYARCETANCKSAGVSKTIYGNLSAPAPPTINASNSNIVAGETVILYSTGCNGNTTWSYQNMTGNSIQLNPSSTSNYSAICAYIGCTSTASNLLTINVICPLTLNLESAYDDVMNRSVIKLAGSTSGGKITATNKITGTANATYQARSIELNAGFMAANGSVFKAETGGCQ